MKKIFGVFFILIAGLTLVACNGNNKPADKQLLIKELENAELLFDGVEILDQTSLNAFDLEIGKYFISKLDYDSAQTVINQAAELLADTKVLQEDVDKAVSELKTLTITVYGQITMGLKVEEAEADFDGVNSQIQVVKSMLFGVVVGSDASEVYRGTQFASKEVLDDVREVVSAAEYLIHGYEDDNGDWIYENGEPSLQDFQKAIEDLRSAQLTLAQNIQRGTKDPNQTIVYEDNYTVNLATLDLGGQVIPFFTHVDSEDNPFSLSFGSDTINRQEYLDYLTKLQRDYNFTFDFQTYKEYNSIAADMAVYLRGTPNAAIMRIPETKIFMDNIKNGNLHPFSSVVNSLQQQYPNEYVINDWQIARGTLSDKVFGIQRNDGVTYPDLMMFNRTILKEVLGSDAKMPDEMWEDGEWTFDNFKLLVNQLNEGLKTRPNITALGITPYYLGINAVNADGVELVDSKQSSLDQQLRINKTEVINILNMYANEFFDQSGKAIWYNRGNSSYTTQYLNANAVNKNHLFDTFKDGNLAIATFQNWQASLLSEVSFEASVVPYPQIGRQDNERYISPIESGDILAVTRGDNHFEVATILMLINKFMKQVQEETYEEARINLGLPTDARIEDIMAAVFVQEKTKNSQQTDIERAREIAAFIHGYHKDYDNARLSDLPALAADDIYSFAIQKRFHQGVEFKSAIDEQMERIKSEYSKVLELLKRFE